MAERATRQTTDRLLDAFEAQSMRLSFRAKLALVWVGIFAVLGLLFVNFGFDIPFIRRQFWFIVSGVNITIFVSVVSIFLAVILALMGALGRLSSNPLFHGLASFYVSFIRGTPLIVQIFFVYLGLPQLARGAPDWMERYLILAAIPSGIIALSVNYGAYMTEIFRAGIQSVGHGQLEAAYAMGMSYPQAMRRVVLPQAIRVIIPPTGNEYIAMLKDSALVSFMGVQELFWRATKVGRQSFRNLEALAVAALVYWLLTIIFSHFQARLEKRVERGHVRASGGH